METEQAEQEQKPKTKTPGTHIGYALAWARKQAGMTRTEVSEKMGCHKSWMSRLEAAEHCPSFESVQRFAKLYGMRVDAIQCGLLPQRLRMAKARGSLKKLEKMCGRHPNGLEELRGAEEGTCFPSKHILMHIARFIGITDLKELLYGSAE